MINTLVTLPLDVLSSKQTVNNNNDMLLKDKKEKEDDDEVVDITTNNDAIMSKTWDSILIKAPSSSTTTTATTTTTYQQQQHQQSTASNSSSASASASSSSTVELVFHETCSRSEDIFSLNSQDNNGDDDEVEVETETENENEDDEDKHNLNTSNCSSSNNTSSSSNSNSNNSTVSSTSNEEYMIRWKQHKLKQQQSRCHQQPQKENRDIPLCNMKVTKNITSMTAKTTTTTIKIKTFISAFIRRYSKLWKGLTPALLLCSNPSIHYTVYDVLKTKLLMSKQHSRSRSSSGSKGGGQQQQLSLSVSDAFILGLLSKFVATIVTYPLIRAKVLLMVEEVGSEDNNDSNSNSNLLSSSSLWSVLKKSYYNDGDGGIQGLYKGCNWQLIHTLLKSALMMTIREQITDRSRSLFDVKTKNKQTNKSD